MHNRREFLKSAGAVSLGLSMVSNLHAKNSKETPNIVIYLSDDQSRYDYGCYGNEKDATPITDALAKESMVFDSAFTAQAICAPSRATIFTGLNPLKHGLYINHTKLRSGLKTIVDYLKPLGYEMVKAGKTHVKPKNYLKWDVDLGFENDRDILDNLPAKKKSLPIKKLSQYFSKKRKKPFCLFLASGLPHGPYTDSPKRKVEQTFKPPFEKSKGKFLQGYYDSIDAKERELKKVLELIESKNLKENTIFIYTSDHGNGKRAKYSCYDSGLRIPFIMRWPGKLKPGRTSELFNYTDIIPTLVDIAGGNVVKNIDGVSFWPTLKKTEKSSRKYTYGVMCNQGTLFRHYFPIRSVHDGRYHYVHNFNAMDVLKRSGKENDFWLKHGAQKHKYHNAVELELFDTFNDPFEMKNLAKLPEHQSKLKELRGEMDRWLKEQGDYLSEYGENKPVYFKTTKNLDEPGRLHKFPESQQGTIKKLVNPHTFGVKS